MHNMWVEFEDFVLVAEGPNNEGQSLEVIRQIRETCGDKPIRYLITTHHHEDHTGGIRTYAAEGAIIITHANNEVPIREQLTLPHTLNPDRLAQSQKEPRWNWSPIEKPFPMGPEPWNSCISPTPIAMGISLSTYPASESFSRATCLPFFMVRPAPQWFALRHRIFTTPSFEQDGKWIR